MGEMGWGLAELVPQELQDLLKTGKVEWINGKRQKECVTKS